MRDNESLQLTGADRRVHQPVGIAIGIMVVRPSGPPVSFGARPQTSLYDMQLRATQDVPEDSLRTLAADLGEFVAVDVEESRTGYKSVDPPSWIGLVEKIPDWVVVLGPSAAVVFNELLKEAGRDLYKNKAAIGRALVKSVGGPLRAAAAAIAKFRTTNRRTHFEVGIPGPDEYFGTRLRLEGQDENAIALELALFIMHCGGIQRAVDETQCANARVIGQVSLSLLPDGSMEAQWMDASPNIRIAKLPPPAA